VGDRARLRGGERAAVDADPEHEVLVFELMRFEGGCPAAVDARFALGVQPPPAEAPVQIIGVDRGESALRVDPLDPVADVESVVFGLIDLVLVQRFMTVDLPLPIRLLPTSWSPGGPCTWCT